MKKISDLSQIKERELNILKRFDQYCKENGLKYFLAYGTLLGAVRHKGFIPWDDDIDVWMPKDDYNKLIKQYKDNRFKLMSVEREKRNQYTYAFAKLVDSETVLIEKVHPEQKLGIYIDIFPLDNLNDIGKDLKLMKKRYDRINYFDTAKGVKGTILKLIGRKQLARINRILDSFSKDTGNYIGSCCVIGNQQVAFNKGWFAKTVDVLFEKNTFPAPIEYHKVLEKTYGDYMKYPSIEEQRPQHTFEAYIK